METCWQIWWSRWWFQTFFWTFSPRNLGKWSNLTCAYFSDGLKPRAPSDFWCHFGSTPPATGKFFLHTLTPRTEKKTESWRILGILFSGWLFRAIFRVQKAFRFRGVSITVSNMKHPEIDGQVMAGFFSPQSLMVPLFHLFFSCVDGPISYYLE